MKAPRFALVLTFVTAAVGGCRASGTEQPEPIGPVPEGNAELVWDLVTDFGMRPEDAKPAVDAAIAAARVHFIAHPDSSLVLDFPPGEWSFLHAVGPAIELAAVEGGRVALKAKAGEQTFRAENVDDLTVRDVRFTRPAAVSLAVKGESNRTLIERVRVERAPAIGEHVPFFSGPGGGPQVEAHIDGPTIRECYVEGTTDDAIAVFSSDAAAPMTGARIERNVIRDGQGRGS